MNFMTQHGTGRCLLGVALTALMFAALGAASSAAAVGPKYPDLRMFSPTELQFQTAPVEGQDHHFLHFATRLVNAGEGALEVDRTPTPSGIADLSQRIYAAPAGFQDVALGSVPFDPMDFSFPVPDIARYELWTGRGFARAEARGFRRGRPLSVQDSVSHCVADVEQVDQSQPPVGVYWPCTKTVSGISVGWANVEDAFNDYQSLDVGATPLPDGDYVLRVIADPTNLLYESSGKADPARESDVANSAVTYFRLVNGQFAGVE
jgi:hypothetical protein